MRDVPRSTGGQAPLHGRPAEVVEIELTLAALESGGGRILVLEGAPGMGKSRLLAEATEMAVARGMTVGVGQADEMDTIAPLTSLLRALTSGTPPVLLPEELRALERPGDQRFWLLEELADILERRSSVRPVVIGIDDLHWADEATVWALLSLTRRLLSLPLGWVLALRPSETSSSVASLIDSVLGAGAVRISLDALDAADVDAIAGDALGATLDAPLRDLLRGAEGNPFLALEFVQALIDEGAVSIADGVAHLEEMRIPEGFRLVVGRRLRRLAPDTTRLLETASVFGGSFAVSDAAALLRMSELDCVPLVDKAVRADVLETDGPRLRFRHDLLRQAVLEGVPAPNRHALHRAAADVILHRGGSAVEAAAHLIEYAEPGDLQAVGVLAQAAGEVAATAPTAAADLMVRATELVGPNGPGWLEMVVGTVGLLAWATRFADATSLADRVLSRGLDPVSDGMVRRGVSDALLLTARRRELIEHAREALARPNLPDEFRGPFLHNLAQGLGQDGQIDAAEKAFQEAVTLIDPADRSLALSCEIGLGLMTAFRGHLADALEMADVTVMACDEAGPEAQQRMPLLAKATILAALDRFDEADATLADAVERATRLGASWALEFTQRILVCRLWWQGRLAEAAAEAEAVLAMAEALDLWHDTDITLGVLGLAAFHANDLESARAYVRRAAESGSRYTRSAPLLGWQFVEALLIDADGQPTEAIAGITDTHFDTAECLTAALAIDGPLAPILTRLALRAGDRARATTVVAASGWMARANPASELHAASARHALGLLDGDVNEVVAAAELLRSSSRLLARGSACEDAGTMLVTSGDRDGGAKYLLEAAQLYVEAGAARDEQRVRRRLRKAGIRKQPRRAPTTARIGWESLTPAEDRVVALASEGLTNREIAERLFLSPYTVGTHLKHVFTKLDVSSRAGLAHAAATRVTSAVTSSPRQL